MMHFEELLLPYMGIAFEKQLHLLNLIGERHQSWFDMNSGQVSFGEGMDFRVQLLGTEAYDSQTWLWGWANKASNIPDALLQIGEQLREYGDEYNIGVLSTAQVNLDEVHNGHTIGMFASGLANANAYYSISYEGGALYVLIDDPAYPNETRDPVQRIVTTFPQLIGAVNVPDHRVAFEGYLAAHDLDILKETETEIQAMGDSNQVIMAQFDRHNRLLNLNANLQR